MGSKIFTRATDPLRNEMMSSSIDAFGPGTRRPLRWSFVDGPRSTYKLMNNKFKCLSDSNKIREMTLLYFMAGSLRISKFTYTCNVSNFKMIFGITNKNTMFKKRCSKYTSCYKCKRERGALEGRREGGKESIDWTTSNNG